MTRRSLAVLVAVAVAATACDTFIEPGATGLVGSWRWVESCGGIGGGCQGPAPGGAQIIVFKPVGIFESYDNDTLVRRTIYQLEEGPGGWLSVHYLDNGRMQLARLRGTDSLTLDDGCCDMYRHGYVRVD